MFNKNNNEAYPIKDIAVQLLLICGYHSNVASEFASSMWKMDIQGHEPRAGHAPSHCEKFSLSSLTTGPICVTRYVVDVFLFLCCASLQCFY